MLATTEDEMAVTMLSVFANLTNAVAVAMVAMKQWSAHHAFIVETFFKNGDSVVKTQ
jgi:hypothetical protein